MDEELYQAFITESRESITHLNNSLLTLESNPDDEEAIDDIFRRAHTLKGNFGAMGFDTAATIAHAVEDLLDEVRQGNLEVTPERMDLVFDGVDLIVDVLDDIEASGETTVEPSDTVAALRDAAEGDDTGDDTSNDTSDETVDDPVSADGEVADGGAEMGADSSESDADEHDVPTERASRIEAAIEAVPADELAEFEALHHVAVTLSAGEMKSVDAGLFLDGVPDHVVVAGADPSLEDIADGDFEDGFDLFVANEETDSVAETFGSLWGVTDCEVTDVSTAITQAGGSLSDSDSQPEESGAEGAEQEASEGANGETSRGGKTADGKSRQIAEVKSVRVDVDQLDELHELVEQLVTSRIKLRQAVGDEGVGGMDTLDELDKISSNLQNTVMDMRLIPLKKVFDKFPRLVRDLARGQDKRVDFRVEGQDIELDRTILDEISDPLMHVLRNAVDHGIEPPEEREAAGKDEQGVVTLSARREHDTVVIEVQDDGGGLDVERIREKAVSKGLTTTEAIADAPDEEVFDYIFHPGFSTNDQITDVSGRGVGMDVVKTTVEALDGSVSVSSALGEGTTFKIRLPVSVAIIKVLFVTLGDRQFGVPIKYIDEIGREERIETINGKEVVVHDDVIYPLIRLRDALGIVDDQPENGMVIRIRPQDRQVALYCDGVTRQEEVVVTPLQGPLAGSEGLSGTAVIGDGNVIPILDVGTLDGNDTGGLSRGYDHAPVATDGGSDR